MFKEIWRCHLRAPDKIIVYFEFLFTYFERTPPPPITTFSKEPTKTTFALIDNRENPMSVLSIILALYNTRTPMTCHLFTSKKANTYYAKFLSHLNVNIIEYPDLNVAHFNIDTYNSIMKSVKFWKILQQTGAEKVVIIQDDGVLARPGIEDLIGPWDYIGAPWADAPGNEYIRDHITRELVGNGGFSARDIAKCLHITETYEEEKHHLFYQNLVEIPEDVYFVAAMMKEKNKIAPRNIATRFSSEQTLDPRALGFHKPWAYFDKPPLESFFTSFGTIN